MMQRKHSSSLQRFCYLFYHPRSQLYDGTFYHDSLKIHQNPLKAPDNAIPYDTNQNKDGSNIEDSFSGYGSTQGGRYQGDFRYGSGLSFGRGFQEGTYSQRQGSFGDDGFTGLKQSSSRSTNTKCVNNECETTTCINDSCTVRAHRKGF